ncbi:bifunctional NAD(P)/FAD-dependent oxidoreductase/class I SAM-dependent methyltransferase [Mycolicibacterium goodii]|uniref:Methyltransferase n=1 Tax=Mycolicibacterium goodii TaxID=134601 RepID=A0A0K0X816_MYCGD|nr:methyltransferase [Mycolicibacterium goodii]
MGNSIREDHTDKPWDCIVVGAGAAGLSAALVLGRARRRVLLVDAGEQSNKPAHGIGGLLGSDGRPPADLYAAGHAELAAYPSVQVRRGEVTSGKRGFALDLADGSHEHARTVLLASGMNYLPPDISGLEQFWGRSVFHCPFCHGWEMRDTPLAVVARSDRAVHSALLLSAWSDDIVVLTDGPDGLDQEQAEKLAAAGISVNTAPIARFVGRDGELTAVEFTDGTRLPRRGAMVATTLHQRSPLAAQLGAIGAPTPLSGDAVVVDALGRTTVPGLFAAGDLTGNLPQVATAIAAGSQTAAAVVQHLLAADVGLPTPPWPTEGLSPGEYWERHYGERDQIWSGHVNPQLEKIAADLPAGHALDLGCGEGGDAVWLAEHGWQVTAVDVSNTALSRAAAEAERRGVADRIAFERHDLSETFPDGEFDLVSAQFLHSTVRLERPRILATAARAIRPGGHLVIVDHGKMPPNATRVPHDHPFPGPEEVLAGLELPAAEWERVRVEAVHREATGPDGAPMPMVDNVMVLRRR